MSWPGQPPATVYVSAHNLCVGAAAWSLVPGQLGSGNVQVQECLLELETKVHTQVRIHGEGPYYWDADTKVIREVAAIRHYGNQPACS